MRIELEKVDMDHIYINHKNLIKLNQINSIIINMLTTIQTDSLSHSFSLQDLIVQCLQMQCDECFQL